MSKIFKDKKIHEVVISYNSYPVLDKVYKRINKNIFDKIYFLDDN